MPEERESGFPPIVLTFAAADPSGGTGVQADVLTLASMGCHPQSVITMLSSNQVIAEHLHVDQVTLDDAFLALTGRSLEPDSK